MLENETMLGGLDETFKEWTPFSMTELPVQGQNKSQVRNMLITEDATCRTEFPNRAPEDGMQLILRPLI